MTAFIHHGGERDHGDEVVPRSGDDAIACTVVMVTDSVEHLPDLDSSCWSWFLFLMRCKKKPPTLR